MEEKDIVKSFVAGIDAGVEEILHVESKKRLQGKGLLRK